MRLQSSTLSLSVSRLWSPTCAFYVPALISAHMRAASHTHPLCLESEICQSQFTPCKTDCGIWKEGLVSADVTYTLSLHTGMCFIICVETKPHFKSAFGHLKDLWGLCFQVSCSTVSLVSMLKVPPWTVSWDFSLMALHCNSWFQLPRGIPLLDITETCLGSSFTCRIQDISYAMTDWCT